MVLRTLAIGLALLSLSATSADALFDGTYVGRLSCNDFQGADYSRVKEEVTLVLTLDSAGTYRETGTVDLGPNVKYVATRDLGGADGENSGMFHLVMYEDPASSGSVFVAFADGKLAQGVAKALKVVLLSDSTAGGPTHDCKGTLKRQ